MKTERIRQALLYWMYGVALAHLAVGLALPWVVDAGWMEGYHLTVENGFWHGAAPATARAQQAWWISLFGPTVQSLSLWMGTLIYLGGRQRSRLIWAMLIAGLVLWAPQDMFISLRAGAWVHVWIDLVALLTMLPPLLWLSHIDARPLSPWSLASEQVS